MKTKFLMIAAGFMAAAVCFTPQTASAAESKSVSTVTATTQTRRKLGWVREGGKWYCYRANGEKARGLVAYKHNWYYTDKQSGRIYDPQRTLETGRKALLFSAYQYDLNRWNPDEGLADH